VTVTSRRCHGSLAPWRVARFVVTEALTGNHGRVDTRSRTTYAQSRSRPSTVTDTMRIVTDTLLHSHGYHVHSHGHTDTQSRVPCAQSRSHGHAVMDIVCIVTDTLTGSHGLRRRNHEWRGTVTDTPPYRHGSRAPSHVYPR
jgi:hypothetical protein